MSLLRAYKSGLKPLVVEEWVDLLIYRPLGFVVAYPLKWTPLTPNMVTWMSALAGLIGAWYILQGTYEGLVAGALWYAFSNVLDCSDGQLARIKQHFSRYGRIYDGVADYLVGLATFLALGAAWRPEGYAHWQWWALVLAGGIVSTTWQGLHLNHVRQGYLRLIGLNGAGKSATHKGKKKTQRSLLRQFFYVPFYGLYRFYLWNERAVRRNVPMPVDLTVDALNTTKMRLTLVGWTFTGKGTHVTMLAVFMLLGRPELYMWVNLVWGALYVLTLRYIHRRLVRGFHEQARARERDRNRSENRDAGDEAAAEYSVRPENLPSEEDHKQFGKRSLADLPE